MSNNWNIFLTPDVTAADAAGAPGQPSVDKITNNSVDLSWKRPRNDGGALDKYVIEAKTPGGEWVPVAEVPAS